MKKSLCISNRIVILFAFLFFSNIRTNAQFCSGDPDPGATISSDNPACSGTDFTLSLEKFTPGIDVNYQWESADDAGFTVNVILLGTDATQVTSQTSAKYYRCLVGCPDLPATTYSFSLEVTMAPTFTWYHDFDNDGYYYGSQVSCFAPASDWHLTTNGPDCDDEDSFYKEETTWFEDEDEDGHYLSTQFACHPPGPNFRFSGSDPGDCDDTNVNIWTTGYFYKDTDGDSYDDGYEEVCYGNSTPSGYIENSNGTDCDDNDFFVNLESTWYYDYDGDGYDDGNQQSCFSPGTYWVSSTLGSDCDDANPDVWQTGFLYIDNDGDHYTTGAANVCYGNTAPDGYSLTNFGPDCDDDNDEKWRTGNFFVDVDGDGYDNGQDFLCYGNTIPTGFSGSTSGYDCDDGNSAVHVGATEICGNNIDDNCDSQIDEGCSSCSLPPTLICPNDIVVISDSVCKPVYYSISAIDECSIARDTFNFTGGMQTWVVPAGVTSIIAEVRGAQGSFSNLNGGKGGLMEAVLDVTPGETLYIFVGGHGGGPAFGFNGGGSGGYPGGGASDIRIGGGTLNERIIVAGGGGGISDLSPCVPGSGGGLTGGDASCGTAGGTQTAAGGNGSFGFGGTSPGSHGGGGGGGWYGGSGGDNTSAGAGGSGYIKPWGNPIQIQNGVQSGNGRVIISRFLGTINQIAGLPSGSVFPVGTTINKFVATDQLGNTDTCTFNVINNNSLPTWYLDADLDGYSISSQVSCSSPGPGYATTSLNGSGDCDDDDDNVNPGATEICGNNIDDDCDSQVDDGCVAPLIINHPSNSTICDGSNTTFKVTASDAVSYQWQVNDGNGFVDLNNGGFYSDVTLPELNITGATTALNNFQYRCIVTGNSLPVAISNPATLFVNTIDDNNICTADFCDTNTGIVTHDQLSGPTDDNNVCTTGELCKSGILYTYPIDISDNNACTRDVCDPVTGVTHPPVDCNDRNRCTIDYCNTVTGCYREYISVDDQNPCTFDYCDPIQGAQHSPVITSDDNVCTIDACNTLTGDITHTLIDFNDGNACTTDQCNSISGITHDLIDCNDNNACTVDGCDTQTGCVYTSVDPNDNNPCTTDGCDTSTGVYHNPVSSEDNNACTTDGCDSTTGVYHNPVSTTDNNVCTIDACNSITGIVSHTQVMTVTTSTTPSGCAGNNGTATANISGGTASFSYKWTPPSIGGQTTQTAIGLAAGNYVVTVTDANNCTATASAVIISTGTSPVKPGPISGSDGACRGQSGVVYCIAPVPGATSYVWTLPPGASGSSTGICISVKFSTSFNGGSICVKSKNACGVSQGNCKNISKISNKPAGPASISGPSSLCPNTSGVFSTALVANATSYIWASTGGLSIVSGQGTNSIVVSANGTFTNGTVSVKSSNCKGSSSAKTKNVYGLPPAPTFQNGGADNQTTGVCGGSTHDYEVAIIPGVNTFTWTGPPGSIVSDKRGHTGNPLTVTGTDPFGEYEVSIKFPAGFTSGNVTVSATNGCGTSTTSTLVIRSIPDQPSSINGQGSVCRSQTKNYSTPTVPGATSYTWSITGGATIRSGQGTKNISVRFTSASSASAVLSVKANNACGSSTPKSSVIAVNLNCKVGEDETLKTIESLSGMYVYPNPTSGKAMISFSSEQNAELKMQVVDLIGHILISENISATAGYNSKEINLENAAKGMYIITFQREGGLIERIRLIVE